CKMVAYVPRPSQRRPGPERGLYVRTSGDSALLALDAEGQRLHAWHGDELRDWFFQHQRWLARRADDSKHERRRPKRRRKRLLLDYEERGRKYHNRLRTWISQTAAELVGLACRRRCGLVRYDDSDQT